MARCSWYSLDGGRSPPHTQPFRSTHTRSSGVSASSAVPVAVIQNRSAPGGRALMFPLIAFTSP